jgi:hypothetical protein
MPCQAAPGRLFAVENRDGIAEIQAQNVKSVRTIVQQKTMTPPIIKI